MRKLLQINMYTVISFLVMFTFAYYVLLQDNFLHLSIASIISRAHYLEIKKHLIVLGLLPVYIGTIIFGAAIVSVYIGTSVQNLLSRSYKD